MKKERASRSSCVIQAVRQRRLERRRAEIYMEQNCVSGRRANQIGRLLSDWPAKWNLVCNGFSSPQPMAARGMGAGRAPRVTSTAVPVAPRALLSLLKVDRGHLRRERHVSHPSSLHLSWRRRVSFESRYGMCNERPSTRALMTLPNAESDRLILFASLSLAPHSKETGRWELSGSETNSK